MPLKPSKQFGGFFMSNFLEKLSKFNVRIRTRFKKLSRNKKIFL